MQAISKNFLILIYIIHSTDKNIEASLTFCVTQNIDFPPVISPFIPITFICLKYIFEKPESSTLINNRQETSSFYFVGFFSPVTQSICLIYT